MTTTTPAHPIRMFHDCWEAVKSVYRIAKLNGRFYKNLGNKDFMKLKKVVAKLSDSHAEPLAKQTLTVLDQ